MPKAPSQVALSGLHQPTTERSAARAAVRVEDAESRATAEGAARAALEKKAIDVLLLDLRGVSGYTDYLVLASGSNERQLEAIADGVEETLREAGHKLVGSEGQGGSRWLLLDFGDVVVHVFHEDERHHYDLEGLWADAPRTRVFEERPAAAREPQLHAVGCGSSR
jgi:ribosome-associated protein